MALRPPTTTMIASTARAHGVNSRNPPYRYTRSKNWCERRLVTVRRSSAWSVPSIARAAGLRRFRASTARRRDTGRMVRRSARSSLTIRVGMISKSKEP